MGYGFLGELSGFAVMEWMVFKSGLIPYASKVTDPLLAVIVNTLI